jgi:hypothetical protein
MVFYIEEVSPDGSNYAYKCGQIFDELLEFYAFLNVWAVVPVDGIDDPAEKYFFDDKKAIEEADELFERSEKVMYILKNLERILLEVESDENEYAKAKQELSEQGILDILCRVLEMIYYKTTPPKLMVKPFKASPLAAQRHGG